MQQAAQLTIGRMPRFFVVVGPIVLKTQQGTLVLDGSGHWRPYGVLFKGTASAEAESRERLQSLLTSLG